jgi:hypothetical protein
MSCTSCGSNSITSCNCNDNCPNKTSDITLFDGNLSYIEVPEGASLNDVLSLMEQYINNSLDDLNLTYVLAPGNCLGIPAGTYGYSQILTAIINTLCEVATEAIASVDTDDVDLVDIVYPDCFSAFSGLTSTDLFNEILEIICEEKGKAIPQGEAYDSDQIGKLIPLSILSDIVGGLADNDTFVYDHTTVVTSPTLLNITVNPMKAVVNKIPVYRSGSQVFSLGPNKDIYFLLADNGAITKIEQTIGNPAPSTVGYAYLYKIVTNGSGVVSYTEQFVATAFNPAPFSIPNNYITTAMIANDQVTSAKLADVVVGTSVGNPSIIRVVFNNKGQIISASSNLDLSSVAGGDIIKYDADTNAFIGGPNLNTGAAGFIPISVGGDFSSSAIEENASYINAYKSVEINTTGTPEANADAGLNVVSGTFVVPRYTAANASLLTTTNATIIYLTSTNVTFTQKGFWGVEEGAWVKL